MLMIPSPQCPVDDPPLGLVWRRASTDGSGILHGLARGAVLRHVVGRRVTVAARRAGEPLVVKAFSSPRARGNARRLDLFAMSGVGDLVPAAAGESRDGHVGLLAFREGIVMDETGDDTFVTGARASGVALRRLHSCGAELDRRWTHADEVARLVRRAPASCARAGAMAAARPVDAYEPLVPSHRDLHPQHVIVSGEAVGFIDLDDCALAPPGLDVGNMVAHLRREALVGRRRVEVAARAVSAFLEAYAVVDTFLVKGARWLRTEELSLEGRSVLCDVIVVDKDRGVPKDPDAGGTPDFGAPWMGVPDTYWIDRERHRILRSQSTSTEGVVMQTEFSVARVNEGVAPALLTFEIPSDAQEIEPEGRE